MAISKADGSILLLHRRIAYEAAKAGKKRLKRIDPFRVYDPRMLSLRNICLLKWIPRKAAAAGRKRTKRIDYMIERDARIRRFFAARVQIMDSIRYYIPQLQPNNVAFNPELDGRRLIWEMSETRRERAVSPLAEPRVPRM